MKKAQNYRLGIFSWFGFIMPINDRLNSIKQAGFESTTLWWEDEMAFQQERKEIIPGMARDLGLYIENIHVPFEKCNNLWSSNRNTREEIVQTHLRWVEDCAKYQIPVMVMHVATGTGLDSPNLYGLKSMERIVRLAEEFAVIIAIENTGRLDYFDLVLQEFATPNLGYCYDSSHDWLFSEEKTLILKKWDKRLISLHLSDNDGLRDRHWLPGHGSVDWNKIAAGFPENIGSGCLTLEVYPNDNEQNETAAVFLQNAYRKINWFNGLLKPDKLKFSGDSV